ncbi:MAG: twin-arginine translocation signal domain-containing protein, partial [Pirellulales bacterium]|nr:twin-arginine translocation signal domain-containing protein [Pirellulales bacterium]
MGNPRLARRDFLKTSVGAVGSVAILGGGLRSWADDAKPPAGDDRPTVGCIGVGGRGCYISREAAKFGRIVAV